MAESTETPKEKKVSAEVKSLRQRRVYLKLRLPALRQEIKDLSGERKTVVEKLKSGSGLDTDEQKRLRERRVYLAQRHSSLRGELKSLAEERKTVGEKLKASK